MKPIVILESPYSSAFPELARRNQRYARACLLDALYRGEAPMASHLLYTLVLDDSNPIERELGMDAGFGFYPMASICAVYTDLGMSDGMRKGVEHAKKHGLPIEMRKVPEWDGRD